MIDKLVAVSNPQVSRIIIALLEDCPLPAWAYPDLVVRLYDAADPTEIDNRQIDYLIVRLYWLIFRNQFPDLVYE
jgi:hypothetical protein